ncbi:sensor domain-containing diguanylate cyclase [Vibrio sp.]|nr:sensor domain-containing diguanylate cyclase [Vibrio sp.]
MSVTPKSSLLSLSINQSSTINNDNDINITPQYNAIVSLIRRVFDVPTAAITFFNGSHLLVRASVGLPREIAKKQNEISLRTPPFCENKILFIEDTLETSEFSNHPLVNQPPYARFYVEYPIYTSSQRLLGTLCLMDTKPRKLTHMERATLKDVADLAENVLLSQSYEQRTQLLLEELESADRRANVDCLTQIWNRGGCEALLNAPPELFQHSNAYIGIGILDLDHFKKINDSLGHDFGDFCLKEVAKRMVWNCRESDAVGRWGGEEFILITVSTSPEGIGSFFDRIHKTIHSDPFSHRGHSIELTCTIGYTVYEAKDGKHWQSALKKADIALYKGKENGRNCIRYEPSRCSITELPLSNQE